MQSSSLVRSNEFPRAGGAQGPGACAWAVCAAASRVDARRCHGDGGAGSHEVHVRWISREEEALEAELRVTGGSRPIDSRSNSKGPDGKRRATGPDADG